LNYNETLDWMFVQLPMYQRQGASAYKIDLSNTVALAKELGDPQLHFKSIHVGGTNGKGSTSHMLASIFQEAGYKVGLYTSPHLKDFRERIRINGICINQKDVIDFVAKNKSFLEKNQLSFFEMTVGLAFTYFAEMKVDIAIIEVGLGGRLDSTNIINPEISIITNIGLDHTQFLGNTFSEIAGEKAGIIKKKVPVVIGRSIPETEVVFRAKAVQKESEIYFAEKYSGELITTDLKGSYQKENLRTVLQTLSILDKKNWNIKRKDIYHGLNNVVRNTGLLGRWQIMQEHPKVICDTAHNEDGLQVVMEQLLQQKYENLHIVLGVVKDKDLGKILILFPKKATYYFSKPDIPRGLAAEKLMEKAKDYELIGEEYGSVSLAYQAALQEAKENDLVYVGGSTFVVAEII